MSDAELAEVELAMERAYDSGQKGCWVIISVDEAWAMDEAWALLSAHGDLRGRQLDALASIAMPEMPQCQRLDDSAQRAYRRMEDRRNRRRHEQQARNALRGRR